MSTITRLQQSLETSCEQGMMCVHDRSGHSLSTIQLRLAQATPSGWTDHVVADIAADGWVTLVDFDGAATRVWHHADLRPALVLGTPVSLHARFDVLATGTAFHNVARA